MSTPASFPPPRVTTHLGHAWGGVWRLTFRQLLQPGHWLMLAIGVAVLVLLCAGGSRWGRPAEFLSWVVGFYVAFLVPALAFISAGGAMRDAIKSNSVDYVLTRPIPRPAFLVFKFLAHTLCTQLDFLFAFMVVVGFVSAHQTPELGAVVAKLLWGQVLMVTAFSALGFLCGAISSRYIVIGLAYAGIIEGGVGQIPTQISLLSMSHQMRDTLTFLLGRTTQAVAPAGIPGTTGIILLFTLLAIVAAAVIFSVRELSGPAES